MAENYPLVTTIGLANKQGRYMVDVRDYGAVGDGVADDTVAIQAAVTAAGSTPVMTPGQHKITASINLPAGSSFTGNGKLTQTTAGQPVLKILGSNVTVSNITLVGPTTGALQANGHGISAIGTVAVPLDNIKIDNVKIHNAGDSGFYGEEITGFKVINCKITSPVKAGVMILGGRSGSVSHNEIRNVTGQGIANSYGIALTRKELATLALASLSEDVVVENNLIDGVLKWEGLDAHGGNRLSFIGNTVRRCLTGIAITASDNDANVRMWAAKNVIVSGNSVEWLGVEGSAQYGILVSGANGSTIGTFNDLATGTVSGNNVVGYGNSTNELSGAIFLRTTSKLAVIGNIITEPGGNGIMSYYDNYNATVTDNIISDVWADTGTNMDRSAAVNIRNSYQDITVARNTLLDTGAKSGKAFHNKRGLGIVTSNATMAVKVKDNDFKAAEIPLYKPAGDAVVTLGDVSMTAVAANKASITIGSQTVDIPVITAGKIDSTYLPAGGGTGGESNYGDTIRITWDGVGATPARNYPANFANAGTPIPLPPERYVDWWSPKPPTLTPASNEDTWTNTST